MTNVEVADVLEQVAAAYAIKDEKSYRFQIIAYQKAADALRATSDEVKDLIKEKRLERLAGIGPAIREHIEKLVAGKPVERFEQAFSGIPQTVFPLLAIPTFGPKKAFKLINAFHLSDPQTVVADIEKLAQENKIATLEGFGEKSQSDILRAIAEFREGKGKTKRMTLPFAGELAEKIVAYLQKSPSVTRVEPLGSLRRMRETIGDIDLAVASKNPAAVITYFTDYPYKERIIEKGDVSAAILTSGGKQVDLLVLDETRFGSLLQHFTGSKNHNVHLREYALKHGMSLSERGIKRGDTIESFSSEEAFYKALGMDWIPPEMREDTGEIELALKHKLPQIIELSDIKGDVHVHSSYPIEPSHDLGHDTMETMVERAIALGYEYIGFSEHNPSVSKHTKQQMYDLLKKRQEHIQKLQEKFGKKITIISLMETDILTTGALALDDKALEYLDGTLASIHSGFSMDKTTMTKRILHGISHPKVRIFSHPTGRLLNTRPGYEVNFDELFDYVKTHNKALEINAWPSRLDLPDILIREAVKTGVPMVIDTDSHALWQMDMMKYGVAQARRGWAQKDNIMNTLPKEKFVQWMKGGE